jgi:hypothetical protein
MNWRLLRVGKIINRVVLLTFAIDKESVAHLGKRNSLTFCMREVRVVTSKGGLIIEEEEGKEESIIEELMSNAQIDDPVPACSSKQ